MKQEDGLRRNSRLSGLTSALKRRRDDRLEISEYHVGNIHSERPIAVLPGALLAGDVLAPEVVVSGLIDGYVACRRLSVVAGGQIWGDVYVNSFEMAPAGKINGWISTLDAGTVDLLRAGEVGKGDLPPRHETALPAEMLQQILESGADVEANQRLSQHRSGIWRQLRSEAALALMARSEIESTFKERLGEALAELMAENAELSKALEGTAMNAEQFPTACREAPDAAEIQVPPDQVDVRQLQAQLRNATAAAQKYYGELLWTRASLHAAKRKEAES
ncbi:MAG: polymer-forming cytoskeletal protein [Chloroflexota bacterium]|nr:MAG: polymer-forming cytoskeletal protein [Chloroflexota bacterium]